MRGPWSRSIARAIVAATLILGAASSARPSEAHDSSRTEGSWHLVKLLAPPDGDAFTAVTATSSTSAWAFERGNAPRARPTAWLLSGSTWDEQRFPGLPGETVVDAGSTGPDDVWAFTSPPENRVLLWNGVAWKGCARMPEWIESGLVINPHDVWAFGAYTATLPGERPLGAWHFDGTRWTATTRIPMDGASAVSPDDVWAFNRVRLARWDGRSWRFASMSAHLDKPTLVCPTEVSAIEAVNDADVWMATSGMCERNRGPFELLHFDGTSWSRLTHWVDYGEAATIAPDGAGGFWIPIQTGFPGSSSLWHLVAGRMVASTLDLEPYDIFGVSRLPQTTRALAVGDLSMGGISTMRAAIFEYEP